MPYNIGDFMPLEHLDWLMIDCSNIRILALEVGTIFVKMDHQSLWRSPIVLGLMFALVMLPEISHADVVLIGNNVSLSFNDMEAWFGLTMKGSGLCGMLQVAEPSDACLPLRDRAVTGEGINSPFALIQRGACSFERKVRNAQDAGFKAAIIYNNKYGPELVPMGGDSTGIVIYAVFVSKAVGQLLLKYVGDSNMECCIIPSLRNAWSMMGISFASLVAAALVLAICIFVRKCWLRQHRQGDPHLHHLHGMSFRLVKELPSLIFSSVSGYNCTSETCAICLEDYTVGEKLRVLPCCHKFHCVCIDSWLTMWRTFCPVCKRDARNTIMQTPVTENTPLLSTNTLISSSIQSAQLSFIGSPYMHIPSISRVPHAESSHSHYSQNISPHISQTLGSHGGSFISSRYSDNIGNTSLPSSGVCSSLLSSESSFHASPEMTPPSVNFRYGSFIIRPPYYPSPEVDVSPAFPSLIPSCGGSVDVISPFNSTHSLPGYQECCV